MSEWKETTLSNICTEISYGYTASAKSEAVVSKLLRITDIVPNSINWETVPYCKADEQTIEKYKLQNGDIVIARTGATTVYNKIIKSIDSKKEFLINFRQLVKLLFEKKETNSKQIHTLEKLRDTLLPKLMSGEVRVVV